MCNRTGVFRRLASRLRVDALKFHRVLDLLPEEAHDPEREEVRRTIGALQALRLALLQHMFLKVVSVPAFSRANDISRTDVLEMVFSLRIEDALAQGVEEIHFFDDLFARSEADILEFTEALQRRGLKFPWFVGQGMKATGGKANPAAVNDILKAKLGI